MSGGGGARLALAAWLSPAFPTGGFAFSSGLETVVASGVVTDEESLGGWIADMLRFGPLRSDAILLCAAYDARAAGDAERLAEVAALAAALAPSAERRVEAMQQGAAFARAATEGWGVDLRLRADAAALPVAVGAAAAAIGADRAEAAALALQNAAQALVHAGQRLIPIGQTAAQRVLRALGPTILAAADAALAADLEDLGGACFLADIAAMRHETQTVRLFRS